MGHILKGHIRLHVPVLMFGASCAVQGLIFVVDSNDRDRIGEARDELHRMLNEVCRALQFHGTASQ